MASKRKHQTDCKRWYFKVKGVGIKLGPVEAASENSARAVFRFILLTERLHGEIWRA